ncbi:unnamed protein product [Owenia fusiformis]|nr:unnamed protein product [Owenia fusiformis]
MYNSADEDIDSKFSTNIVVYSTGVLSWVPIGLYISSCSIDIKWFPFDEQKCIMKFGSWTYDGANVNLTLKWQEVDISTYQESGEWALIGRPAERNIFKYECCIEEYIDITFTLHIRRKTLYYGFNLIIPCFMISSLAILVFVLPPDAGEKIGLGVTILLALSVFMMIVAEMIPATSGSVPILAVYFACIMVMCTLSVCLTVLVLNFHHRNPDMYIMPSWVKTLICEWGAWVVRLHRPGRDISRRSLKRKSAMRDLEKQLQPSKSLIMNIKDDDDYYPYTPSSFGDMPSMQQDDNFITKTELKMILRELRSITNKIKEDNESGEEINDWKFAAMVIDRMCLWVFLTFTLASTLAVFFSIPHIFNPNEK